MRKRQVCVQRALWKGHITIPKGGRLRYLPMTERLTDALRRYRHERNRRVLCTEGGKPLTEKIVSDLVRRSAVKAGLADRGVHLTPTALDNAIRLLDSPADSGTWRKRLKVKNG